MGIRLSRAGLSQLLQPEPGWQKLQVIDIKEEMAKDKRSVNIVTTFEVIESSTHDKNIGRTITRYFNQGEKAQGFFYKFLAAVWNLTLEDTAKKIVEMDEKEELLEVPSLKGVEVWNELVEGVYNERPQMQVSDKWCAGEGEPPF